MKLTPVKLSVCVSGSRKIAQVRDRENPLVSINNMVNMWDKEKPAGLTCDLIEMLFR